MAWCTFIRVTMKTTCGEKAGTAAPPESARRFRRPLHPPAATAAAASAEANQQQQPPLPKNDQPKDEKQRRLNPIKLRQAKERQRAIEDEITRLEVEIADFEQALSHFQSAQHSIDIAHLLESRRTDMKNLMSEWEEVSETH